MRENKWTHGEGVSRLSSRWSSAIGGFENQFSCQMSSLMSSFPRVMQESLRSRNRAYARFALVGALLSLFIFSQPLLAEEGAQRSISEEFRCSQKEKGEPIPADLLGLVQKAYDGVSNLKARFVQHSYIPAANLWQEEQGEVWFAKPGQMKWVYALPTEQIFLVAREVLWHYQPAERQVVRAPFQKVLVTDLPLTFLMGVGKLPEDFRVEESCRVERGLLLRLVPLESEQQGARKSELNGFDLIVDREKYLPVAARVRQAGGNTNIIFLDERKENVELLEDTFAPNFPRGIDVVETK